MRIGYVRASVAQPITVRSPNGRQTPPTCKMAIVMRDAGCCCCCSCRYDVLWLPLARSLARSASLAARARAVQCVAENPYSHRTVLDGRASERASERVSPRGATSHSHEPRAHPYVLGIVYAGHVHSRRRDYVQPPRVYRLHRSRKCAQTHRFIYVHSHVCVCVYVPGRNERALSMHTHTHAAHTLTHARQTRDYVRWTQYMC